MINHSTKIERSKIWPLRWIGNISGEFAGNHIVKCANMDEDEDFGWRSKSKSSDIDYDKGEINGFR